MAKPTQQQIQDLRQRLLQIYRLDISPGGETLPQVPHPFTEADALKNAEPIIISYKAVCSDGTDLAYCPDNNINFINIKMQDSSLGYPSKIISPFVDDEATKAKKEEEELLKLQAMIEKKDPMPPEKIKELGATHYIYMPPGIKEGSLAVLRAGFVSSKTNSLIKDLKMFDTWHKKEFYMNKRVFNSKLRNKNYPNSGHVIQLLENNTPIKIIREGFGIGGFFAQVAIYDQFASEWKFLNKVSKDPAFVDSRLLKRVEDNILELPLVETADPDPPYRGLYWKKRKKCDPVLNKETNEYEATLELPAQTTNEEAKRKGIEFLLEYYGKKFDKSTVDRLMTAGGPNYSNYHKRKNPNPSLGLFAVCKRVDSSARPDGLKKFLITSPVCYMNHPSLEVDLNKLLTRDDYVEKGLVTYQYTFNTNKLDSKIRQLNRNLKRFQKRIDNFNGEITLSSTKITSKIDRIKRFKRDFDNFLTINKITPEEIGHGSEIEVGLDNVFKVVFITYRPIKEKECEFLRIGLNCINENIGVFEDTTASAYMFYADKITIAVSDEEYPGIELVQKFTVPVPEVRPSKKEKSADTANGIKPIPAEEEEKLESLENKSAKTKKDVQEENTLINNPTRKSNKAKKIKRMTFPTGDQATASLSRLMYSTNTTNDLFGSALDTMPLKSSLARYAYCISNKVSTAIDPEGILGEAYSNLETTTNLFFDMQEQLPGKDLSQIGFEFPKMSYSDDPLKDFEAAIKLEMQVKLNEALVPVVKDIMQNMIDSCQGLNLDMPLINNPSTEPDPQNLDPNQINSLDDALNLPLTPNLPGASNILNNFDNQAIINLREILRNIIIETSGIMSSSEAIRQFGFLLDLLSGILRPTEICTLLSGEATDTVLTIVLALVQARPEFSLLSEFFNTIDNIRDIFKTLGAFANVNYCKTFTEDLTLVSLLCEKELNKEAYCQTLQGKGFTPQQCEDILAEELEDDQQKMITLSEMLTAESISDYFQNQAGPMACTPDSPGLLPPNNDFLDQIVSNALDSTIGMVESTTNSELIGVSNLFIDDKIIAYGADYKRPPEEGRDYAFSTDNKRIGLAGTPYQGVLFYDEEFGTPIIDNWPNADKVSRTVTPTFKGSIQQTKDIGAIKIINKIGKFSKTLAVSIEQLEQSLQAETQNKFLEIFQNYNISELEEPTKDALAQTIGNLTELVEQVNQNLKNKTVERNLVEYKLPSYAYLKSDEAKDKNLTQGFVRFITNALPLKKDGGSVKTTVFDSLSNIPDKETLNYINFLEQSPQESGGSLDLDDQTNLTLQEYSFAKILSISLNKTNNSQTQKVKTQIESQFSKLFTFSLSKKQNDILKECLKSRFFKVKELEKLLVSPLTNDALQALACADHPNINLEDLKKGLLDFKGISQQVNDFYNDVACEEGERDPSEPDPMSDAIQYGMALVFIKLIIAEVAIRSLFFFSRFNAIETMVDSDIFTSLILTKFRDQSENSIVDQTLLEDIENVAYKKLLEDVSGKEYKKFLINEIAYDNEEDIEKRTFTNIKDHYFNLHDLTVLKEWKEDSRTTDIVEKIIDNVTSEDIEIDFTDSNISVLIRPVIAFYESRFKTLALKIIINELTTEMAPRVNSIFLDASRQKVATSRILLASDTIFDIPSDVISVSQGSDRQGGDQGLLEDFLKEYLDLVNQHKQDHDNWILAQEFENLQEIVPATADDIENALPQEVINMVSEPEPALFINKQDFTNRMADLGYIESSTATDKAQPIPVIDYKYELQRLNQSPSILKNVCLDAYDDGTTANGKFYSKSTKSTFYNNNGALTELGKSTKNGGFILQKYVKVKFHSFQSYRDYYTQIGKNLESNLTKNTFNMLLEKIKTKVLNLGATSTFLNPLYNPEDYSDPDAPNVWGLPEDETWESKEIEETESDVMSPAKHILLSYKQFDWVLLELTKSTLNFNLDEIFQYIKHGVRLVYVMPHDVDIASPQKINEFSRFVEHIGRRPAIGSIPIGTQTDSDLSQIEHLLYEHRPPEEQDNLKQNIFAKKIFQIREPTNALAADLLEFEDIVTAGGQFGILPPPPPPPIDNRLVFDALFEEKGLWDKFHEQLQDIYSWSPSGEEFAAQVHLATYIASDVLDKYNIIIYPEALAAWSNFYKIFLDPAGWNISAPEGETADSYMIKHIKILRLKVFGEYATQTVVTPPPPAETPTETYQAPTARGLNIAQTNTGMVYTVGDITISSDSYQSYGQIYGTETYNSETEVIFDNPFVFKPKVLQSFYILPITEEEREVEEVTANINLLDTTNTSIRELLFYNDQGTPRTAEEISNLVSVVEKYGADPKKLVPKIFENPTVKTLNNYVFSSTNLLNFAVLQQTFFPYSETFDFNNIFSASKQAIKQISNTAQEGRDDRTSTITEEGKTGFSTQIDRAMSAQIPKGAYYKWIESIAPLWMLRTYLKSADPCMRDAFKQQEIYGYDDKKLPEILFGSLFVNPAACADLSSLLGDTLGAGIPLPQINGPGDGADKCLPGIRPVPIFPPGPPPFGFFGNPYKPVTAPGLVYMATQFLTGFDEKYSDSVDEQGGASESNRTPDGSTATVNTPYDSDICDPNSNLNQNPNLITQEPEGE